MRPQNEGFKYLDLLSSHKNRGLLIQSLAKIRFVDIDDFTKTGPKCCRKDNSVISMGILRMTNGCPVMTHRHKRILWLAYIISGLDLYTGHCGFSWLYFKYMYYKHMPAKWTALIVEWWHIWKSHIFRLWNPYSHIFFLKIKIFQQRKIPNCIICSCTWHI